MKKKGLIISTVVMVVVLIASLTTATYAWISVSNKTTIEGFNVLVVAGNAVNIGVKTDNAHKTTGITNDDFMSGTVTWTNGTPGTIGASAGSWSGGTVGLSSSLNHQIEWGAQTKAVGAISGATNPLSTDSTQYGFIGDGTFNTKQTTGKATGLTEGNSVFLNAANLDKGTTLTTPTPAYANIGKDSTAENVVNGDYAYLFLGASPTKALKTNTLVIMLDGSKSSGTNVGILAAVHVAYRVTKQDGTTSAWKEEEFFPNAAYNSKLTDQTVVWASDAEKAAYVTAFTNGETSAVAPTSKAGIIRITDLSLEQNDIDQIEIIVYLAGSDSDCIDSGKNASGEIKMFFFTEDAAA